MNPACAFVFDSRVPCGASEDHPIHHEDWNRGRPNWEPDHLFVPGPGEPIRTYTETLERSIRLRLAAKIEKLPTWDKRTVPGGFHVNRQAVLEIVRGEPAPTPEPAP